MKYRWPIRLAAGALVAGTLSLAALAAGSQGSQTDPLISLSYLTDQFTPSILQWRSKPSSQALLHHQIPH